MLDLPKAPVPPEGLKAMKRGPWSPHQIVDMGWKEAAGKLELDARLAERTVYGCEDWITAINTAWAGVLPPVTEGNA